MKLERREWITIGIGGALVVAVLVWKIGGAWASSGSGGVIAEKCARLADYVALRQQVVGKSKQLKIDLPMVESTYQEYNIRQELSQLASGNGLQIGSTRVPAARSRGGVQPLPFRLELAGQFASVISFVNALEQSKTPFIIRNILIEQGGAAAGGGGGEGGPPGGGAPPNMGGRGGGGQRPSDGSVRVTMQVDSYLFPNVHVSKDEEKKLDEKMPKPTPQSAPPMMMSPSMPPGGGMAPPMMRTPRTSGSPPPGAESRPSGPASPMRMGRPSAAAMEKLNAHRAEIEQMMKENPAKAQEYIKQLMGEGGGQ